MSLSLFEKYYKDRGEFKNIELTLNRIKEAADACGISDNIAKNTIHIAGTNGKGSTAYFIDQILRFRGFKTALFTSPHIHKVNERIRLNGECISDEAFDFYFEKIKAQAEKFNLSYFESLTLAAFLYFKDNMPDAAVIETGLGGRFDSTNILNSKIPVITSMSVDHTEYLGTDIFRITDEKLAIIKDNPTVFIGNNHEYMNTYLYDKLKNREIVLPEYNSDDFMGFPEPYNNNLRLAFAVADRICPGKIPHELKLPMCRMERFGRIVLDGAHNEAGLTCLTNRYRHKQPVAVFSLTRERDFEKLFPILSRACSVVVLTEIPENSRSIDITQVSAPCIKVKSPESALKLAVELSENTDILVCGSLYLCAYIREILTKGKL